MCLEVDVLAFIENENQLVLIRSGVQNRLNIAIYLIGIFVNNLPNNMFLTFRIQFWQRLFLRKSYQQLLIRSNDIQFI